MVDTNIIEMTKELDRLKSCPIRVLWKDTDKFLSNVPRYAAEILRYHAEEFDYLEGEQDSYCTGEASMKAQYLARLYSETIVSEGYGFSPSKEMTWESKKMWAHSPRLLVESILKGWAYGIRNKRIAEESIPAILNMLA